MSIPSEIVSGLSALHPADRRWLLARLSVDERRRLQKALAVGSDQSSAVAPVTSVPAKASDVPPQESLSQDEALLANATPEAIAAVLQELSPSCIGLLLKRWHWPWAEQVVVLLPPNVRKALPKDSVSAKDVRTRFANWFLHEVAEALRARRAASVDAADRFESLMDTPTATRP
jgi:hypothetical protein